MSWLHRAAYRRTVFEQDVQAGDRVKVNLNDPDLKSRGVSAPEYLKIVKKIAKNPAGVKVLAVHGNDADVAEDNAIPGLFGFATVPLSALKHEQFGFMKAVGSAPGTGWEAIPDALDPGAWNIFFGGDLEFIGTADQALVFLKGHADQGDAVNVRDRAGHSSGVMTVGQVRLTDFVEGLKREATRDDYDIRQVDYNRNVVIYRPTGQQIHIGTLTDDQVGNQIDFDIADRAEKPFMYQDPMGGYDPDEASEYEDYFGRRESKKHEMRQLSSGDVVDKFYKWPHEGEPEVGRFHIINVSHIPIDWPNTDLMAAYHATVQVDTPGPERGTVKHGYVWPKDKIESLKHERRTPWGQSDAEYLTNIPGLAFYTTPSHGGFFVPHDLVIQLPGWARAYAEKWTGSPNWFEEDVAAAIVLYFWPEAARALGDSRSLDEIKREAASSIRHWIPEAQLSEGLKRESIDPNMEQILRAYGFEPGSQPNRWARRLGASVDSVAVVEPDGSYELYDLFPGEDAPEKIATGKGSEELASDLRSWLGPISEGRLRQEMTEAQQEILYRIFTANNAGAVNFEGQWIFPEDVRQDPALADRMLAAYRSPSGLGPLRHKTAIAGLR